jgi:hypothetical protein
MTDQMFKDAFERIADRAVPVEGLAERALRRAARRRATMLSGAAPGVAAAVAAPALLLGGGGGPDVRAQRMLDAAGEGRLPLLGVRPPARLTPGPNMGSRRISGCGGGARGDA